MIDVYLSYFLVKQIWRKSTMWSSLYLPGNIRYIFFYLESLSTNSLAHLVTVTASSALHNSNFENVVKSTFLSILLIIILYYYGFWRCWKEWKERIQQEKHFEEKLYTVNKKKSWRFLGNHWLDALLNWLKRTLAGFFCFNVTK